MVFCRGYVTCGIATLIAASLAGIASAEPPAYESTVVPTTATVPLPAVGRPVASPAEKIAFGDWYTIDVERAGLRRRFEGQLVKASDEWIVLYTVSEGRSESGNPAFNRVPYLNRVFGKTVGIGYRTDFKWIPRDAAQIAGHVRPEISQPVKMVDKAMPPATDCCTALYAGREKLVEQNAKLIDANPRAIVIAFERIVCETHEVPVLSKLPGVGKAFQRVEQEYEPVREEIARDKLLCVTVMEYGQPLKEFEPMPEDGEPLKK